MSETSFFHDLFIVLLIKSFWFICQVSAALAWPLMSQQHNDNTYKNFTYNDFTHKDFTYNDFTYKYFTNNEFTHNI